MKRDLQDQFDNIPKGFVVVGISTKILSTPKGRDIYISFLDRMKIVVHSFSNTYTIYFIASKYFHDINKISQEEVVLFLIESDRWFQNKRGVSKEINTNPKLTYPTSIVDLMSGVMEGLEDQLC